jgi:hypothetical protein
MSTLVYVLIAIATTVVMGTALPSYWPSRYLDEDDWFHVTIISLMCGAFWFMAIPLIAFGFFFVFVRDCFKTLHLMRMAAKEDKR